MSPGVLLMVLRHSGFEFRPDGQRVVCRALVGVLTAEDIDVLRRHRETIPISRPDACRTWEGLPCDTATIYGASRVAHIAFCEVEVTVPK